VGPYCFARLPQSDAHGAQLLFLPTTAGTHATLLPAAISRGGALLLHPPTAIRHVEPLLLRPPIVIRRVGGSAALAAHRDLS
jgi:hypothetical protein